ncbi:rhodanese-like domain-containing protein [Chitinophaga sp. XS-30]|uniref:rhodanese-like domain-containing protein n=1 Tax=Chitinophaga sp. XS-30 TaxID=2604421 RepID=UPI00143D0701|nr:rhodanese-like domain-containing protein [Chitinophaga sp. XS-30]
MLTWVAAKAQEKVSPDAFEKGMHKPGVQLLDVRTAEEFRTGYLPDALQADFTNKEEFFSRIRHVDKHKPVYIYCLSGGRSAAAAKWMRSNGYTNVVEMEGGIISWKKAGKTLTGSDKNPQMTISAYASAVSVKGWVLVDVGAAWCPPCRKMEPVVQQLVSDKKLKRVNVDGGKDADVMKTINAGTLPTFLLYKDGKEVWRKEGLVTMEAFLAAMK